MSTRPKLLWLGDESVPPNVQQAVAGRWDLVHCGDDRHLLGRLDEAGLAVVYPNGQADEPRLLERLLDTVDRTAAVAVVLLPPKAKVAWGVLKGREGKFLCVDQDVPPGELLAKLDAAEALQPFIRNLERELEAARHLGCPSAGQIDELDEEMRLAARLQRDFLPRRLPEVGSVRFGVLYRPLGWVSGDIYDVARLDETHVGFYVADAVGHGMPAALLTMFIKNALQTKRIAGNSYEIIPPHESLRQLNAAICEQNLSSCQFCTAAYCVLDVPNLSLTYARAGHPEPVLIHADGSPAALASPGCLLGVFAEADYRSTTVPLSPGDRLVLYTDGVEDALSSGGDKEQFKRLIASIGGEELDEMLLQLAAWIDERGAKGRPEDDVTIVAMDVAE